MEGSPPLKSVNEASKCVAQQWETSSCAQGPDIGKERKYIDALVAVERMDAISFQSTVAAVRAARASVAVQVFNVGAAFESDRFCVVRLFWKSVMKMSMRRE